MLQAGPRYFRPEVIFKKSCENILIKKRNNQLDANSETARSTKGH